MCPPEQAQNHYNVYDFLILPHVFVCNVHISMRLFLLSAVFAFVVHVRCCGIGLSTCYRFIKHLHTMRIEIMQIHFAYKCRSLSLFPTGRVCVCGTLPLPSLARSPLRNGEIKIERGCLEFRQPEIEHVQKRQCVRLNWNVVGTIIFAGQSMINIER